MTDDGAVVVEHLNLDDGGRQFAPAVDLEAGYTAALAPLSAPIVDGELLRRLPAFRALFTPDGLDLADAERVRAVLHDLAVPRWEGDASLLTTAELVAAVRAKLPASLATQIVVALERAEAQ